MTLKFQWTYQYYKFHMMKKLITKMGVYKKIKTKSCSDKDTSKLYTASYVGVAPIKMVIKKDIQERQVLY